MARPSSVPTDTGSSRPDAQSDPASRSKLTFDTSIRDAEELLEYCKSLGHPLPKRADVFKRAGLVMALTAWETYVEDRILEGVQNRLGTDEGHAAKFMLSKLEDELKRFHNPNSGKTKKIFADYLEIDITVHWKWGHFDAARAAERLDELVKKRGDAVHRSRQLQSGASAPHLVTKEDLEKAIRFLKELVCATDRALSESTAKSQSTSRA